jgi:hypothetical protein
MTKKPMTNKKLTELIHDALMAQDHYYGMGEIDCWGVTMTDAWRNPGVLEQLIEQGKFGGQLGQALRAMIRQPYTTPPIDHELRVFVSDGHGYALFIAVKKGVMKLALLVFQRGPTPFSDEEKAKMFKALDIAAVLVRRNLEEQIAYEAKEQAEADAKQEGEG